MKWQYPDIGQNLQQDIKPIHIQVQITELKGSPFWIDYFT